MSSVISGMDFLTCFKTPSNSLSFVLISMFFSNPNFVYKKEYEVEEGADFETVESEAIEEVSGNFARSLVIMILEGF